MNNKKLIYAVLAIIVFGLTFLVFIRRNQQILPPATEAPVTQSQKEDSPRIVSTRPNPLEEAIVGANETIEIIFNRSLENVGEFKVRIEPKIEYKLELSQDRKTAKIIPLKPYELGTGYTLFIGHDTKFDGVGAWGQEKIYHFKTIRYRGV